MGEMTTTARGVAPAWTPEQVDLIKQTVCKGSTDAELKLFLYTAARTGLDPLARQIHAVKRGGVMTIQTGIDGYRLTADRTNKYAPGAITVNMKDGKPESATAVVRKKVEGEWCEVSATAYYAEYAVPNSPMWAKMPRLMISKCAEALALRRAFPAELSGVYTADEMGQADAPAAASASGLREPQPVKAAVKPAPEHIVEGEVVDEGTAQEPPPDESHEPAPAEAPAPGARVITEKMGKRLYAKWKEAGKSDKQVRAHLKEKYGYSSTRDIKSGAEYETICAWAEDKGTTVAEAA